MTRWAVAVMLTVGLLSAQTPATADTTYDMQLAAIQRIGNGTWTQADIDYIKTFPDLADQVADPTSVGTWTEASGDNADGIDSSKVNPDGTTCGHWYDVWFKKFSILHSTVYTWHHKIVVCWIYGDRVTSWVSRTDYLSQAQSMVQFEKLIAESHYIGGHGVATSFRQRHIELCILKYGCYQNLYPWSEIWIGPSGGHGYKGGSG